MSPDNTDVFLLALEEKRHGSKKPLSFLQRRWPDLASLDRMEFDRWMLALMSLNCDVSIYRSSELLKDAWGCQMICAEEKKKAKKKRRKKTKRNKCKIGSSPCVLAWKWKHVQKHVTMLTTVTSAFVAQVLHQGVTHTRRWDFSGKSHWFHSTCCYAVLENSNKHTAPHTWEKRSEQVTEKQVEGKNQKKTKNPEEKCVFVRWTRHSIPDVRYDHWSHSIQNATQRWRHTVYTPRRVREACLCRMVLTDYINFPCVAREHTAVILQV